MIKSKQALFAKLLNYYLKSKHTFHNTDSPTPHEILEVAGNCI